MPPSLNFPQLDFVEPSNGFHPVIWERVIRKKATGRQGAGRNNHVTLGTVGRMYFVQPSEGERYYLRILLTHVVGATCFEDLRTTHRPHTPTIVVHPTFKAACLAHGLLQMMLNLTSAF